MRTALFLSTMVTLTVSAWPASSQIIPDDSLGTSIDVIENTFEIQGGELSNDGANLFHSFEAFGLDADQAAIFLTTSEIQNVLGRVTGGNASSIDGLIQVTGSDANLFLLNPAGIVFGENASLDVMGDFTATTAGAIEFEDGWFEALGGANWSDLVGDPVAFEFVTEAGAIVNLGDLSVNDDASLNLLGGTAINRGQLQGGAVNIAAIEAGNTVQLSLTDQILRLEVASDRVTSAGDITAIALPELLTGSLAAGATELTTVDGVVQLRATPIGVGDVAFVDGSDGQTGGEIITQTATVFAMDDLLIGTSGVLFNATGGSVILAADADVSGAGSLFAQRSDGSETLSDTDLEGSGITTRGGDLQVSGHTLGIDVISSGSYETDSGERVTVAEGGDITIEARGNLTVGGLITNASEQAGNITLSSGDRLQIGAVIQADADRNAGDATLTAVGDVAVEGLVNLRAVEAGDIIIRSETGAIQIGGFIQAFGVDQAGDVVLTAARDITVGDGVDSNGGQEGGNVTIKSATGNVSIAGFVSSYSEEGSAGEVVLTAAGGITVGDSVDSNAGQEGGNVTIESATGNVSIASFVSSYSNDGSAGDVRIRAPQGAIDIGRELETYATGEAGQVDIVAAGDITIGSRFGQFIEAIRTEPGFDPNLWATVQTYAGENAGNISLSSTSGSIRLNNATYTDSLGQSVTLASVRSSGLQRSGNLTLATPGNINAGEIITQASGGNSGTIAINGNNVTTGNVSSIGVTGSGSIRLSSTGSIIAGDATTTASAGQSGDIAVNSQVDAILGNLRSEGGTGSGNINVQALRNIITGDITSKAIQGDSGNVSLNAGGDITTGDIASIADNGTSGNISLEAGGTISTGTLTTADGTISTTSDTASAGGGNSGTEVTLELEDLERRYNQDFLSYLGSTPLFEGSMADTEATVATLFADRNVRIASVLIELLPDRVAIRLTDPDHDPQVFYSPIDRDTVLATIDTYRAHLVNARYRLLGRYNDYAAQLYDWLIRPIAPELEARNIDTLMFSVDAGLRSLPFSALYDGENYLIEQYSYSLIPSLGLVDPRYQPLAIDAPMLAMGASQFTRQAPLPAVPAELNTLINHRRDGNILLNDAFTRANVIQQRQRNPFPIIHLATHGEFNGGTLENSYLQLWDDRIGLDEIRELGWSNPPVELLVLSACQTALGNSEAEMGFAGLAVAAGVKTAIASLWYVDDAATFMLMTELYHHLATAPIKVEALRSAQLSLLNGNVRIEDGWLYADGIEEPIAVPETLHQLAGRDFSNPYFWSAFTAIGSPW
jgi:filamentous hemagglutinin family protein